MRKIGLLVWMIMMATLGIAQERQGMYIYRNSGAIDIFYTADVDSIFYSNYDLDGVKHPEIVTQMIRMRKSQVRIPLAEIDSVSFSHPDPKKMRQEGKLSPITNTAFRSLVWDYKKNPNELVFEGERPVVIDYWAPWCGYCIQMMPLVEQLAQEYKGKVDFYKVNADDEDELWNLTGMNSLPCFFFYPKKGQPVINMGMMDLSGMRKIIEEVLLITDDENPDAEKPVVELSVRKGDEYKEWTDRKITALMKCGTKNAELVKYGCFKKEEVKNSGLTPREFVQNYGQVLTEEYLPKVNSDKGMSMVFRANKNTSYVFICMIKNEAGGIAVESSEVTTDATFIPAIELQVERGAIAEYLADGKPMHASVYLKTKEAAEMHYACILKKDYDEALASGIKEEALAQQYGRKLNEKELERANSLGFVGVFSGLKEMTDYICLATTVDIEGKHSIARGEVTTPFQGYNEEIPDPDVILYTGLVGTAITSSVNCGTGDAIYTALLLLPSEEVDALIAQGKSLTDIMETHKEVSVFSSQQVEWVNGQGVSNVRPEVVPGQRYTWIVDVRARLGGRVVRRSEIQALPKGMTTAPIDVKFSASCSQQMMTVSASCYTANATFAQLALVESETLAQLLTSGKTLEDLMDHPVKEMITFDQLTNQQLEWFNQNGYTTGYTSTKRKTYYTWIIDVRDAAGNRVVKRTECEVK